MSKCSKSALTRYIEGLCKGNLCFNINWFQQISTIIKLLNYLCPVFMSLLMVLYSKKYKSIYPNTIWSIIYTMYYH